MKLIYETLKTRLSYIHISNWHKNNEHWMITEGLLPLESFLTKLAKDGYQAPISLKMNLETCGDEDLKQIKSNLKKCKEFYEEYFLKQVK